jgi:D-alanine-D-alanine ligase
VADKIRIGVLFGGQSGEHEVSLVSARAVMDGLDRDHYEVIPIGITKQGRWIAGGNALPALEAMADPKLLPGGPPELKIENEKLRNIAEQSKQI